MATLLLNSDGDVCVTLRGAVENRVFMTLRGWAHWLRFEFERDPQNPALCLAVTLITSRMHEVAVREIFKRGFGMTFPPEGGSCALPLALPTPARRRGSNTR
jgi:hypothetical protein